MKKLIISILSLLIIASSTGCSQQPQENPEMIKAFDQFIEKDFIETMESDYTTKHIYLENPQDYGVDSSKVEVSLGSHPDKISEEEREEFQETVDEFNQFHRDELTPSQQETYDICKYMIEISKASMDQKYDYYRNLFASMGGIHYQIPVLFSDYALRNEQDVKDVILLVKDVKPYLDACLNYTKTQAEKGLLMLDFEEIISYCETLLSNRNQSSILYNLYDSIDALKLGNGNTYKQELLNAFEESFFPAYENIITVFKDLQQNATNNEKGLCAFPNGKSYYEIILKQNTGGNKSVKELKKMLNDAYQQAVSDMQKAVFKDYEAALDFIENGNLPETKFDSYQAILEANHKMMQSEFPKVDNLQYNIRDISKDIASDSGIAAYFNIPPIDHSGKKELRVNPNGADLKSLSTFQTVSHEGFPGHMYQYAYMYENLDSPWRKAIANCNAYSEGYAVYAQYEAYDYLQNMNETILEISKANEIASYCIIMLSDIGIHYEGWDFTQFHQYLTSMGFALPEEDAKTQYKQLWNNPGAFQSYYVGYLEIINLKEQAQNELKNKFDELKFHEALLSSGSAPFNVVKDNIEEYIESSK